VLATAGTGCRLAIGSPVPDPWLTTERIFNEIAATVRRSRACAGIRRLPPLAERLPAEPLVVAPYAAIGSYGGVINGLSRATESGTSDLLSVRHVNLVRYADDLQTIVPNVARSLGLERRFHRADLPPARRAQMVRRRALHRA
jgi:hypothetical protein